MSESYSYFEDVNLALLRLWGKRSGLRVLDVGCGFATTTEQLQKLGNPVLGIEVSAEAAEVARKRIGQVVQCDVEDLAAVARYLGDTRFDAIIFADILEHLPRPLPVLRHYLGYLKRGGSVFVSLPNVGLWSVRLGLLAGSFEYQDTGVLDRTHLRFFTRKSAEALLDEAGLKIVKRRYNPGVVRPFVPLAKKFLGAAESGDPRAILDSPAYQRYLKFVHPLERAATAVLPGPLAFQMVFEAKEKA